MKTYYFTYTGIYPVGACGVVTAPTKKQAFNIAISTIDLEGGNVKDFVMDDLTEYDTTKKNCEIILDGNY